MQLTQLCIHLFIHFSFHHTATTYIYTLSHTTLFRSVSYAKNIYPGQWRVQGKYLARQGAQLADHQGLGFSEKDDDLNIDRKSTRLNSSHVSISYAVFCLKKKNKYINT